MKLTPIEEERLIKQYNNLVWRTVRRFKRRMTHKIYNEEDLYQEAMLVFVNHIRKAETMDELHHKIPIRDMINAMCRLALRDQIVSFPERTSSFSDFMSKLPDRAEYTDIDMNESMRDHSVANADARMLVKEFFESLPKQDRELIAMKYHGMTNREISARIGSTDLRVCRQFKRLRSLYEAFVA